MAQLAKGLQVRPSVLYGIEDQLTAFYFDRGIYWWGNFVDNKVAEAEAKVRQSFKNKKGTDVFVNSERAKTMSKLLGDTDSTAGYRVYADPARKKKAVPANTSGMDPKLFTG